jgi:hypothetical protein
MEPNIEILPGDIILSRADNWLSKAIRFFGKLQTGEAEYSHASFAVGDGMCVEALERVRESHIEEKYGEQSIEIWRTPLTDEDRQKFKIGMRKLAGNSYGWTKIPLFAADAVATKVTKIFGRKKPVFFFSSKVGLFNIQVCSQLGQYGFIKFTTWCLKEKAGEACVPWRVISPDLMQDLLHHPHNKCYMIYKQVTV